ncbi:MAG: glycosyltransferase family 2 protein [Acidimicrobiia bacterium]
MLDYRTESMRERLECREERRLLAQARRDRDVCWVEESEAEPLVTIRIATYNQAELVVDRAIASAQAQTYPRLEILVLGDHCDDPTRRAVESINDPRLRFVDLPTRGMYPPRRAHLRKVAGSHPMNAGLFLARGAWIAPCDDDDELTADHVEALLKTAKSGRLEMVYSKARHEIRPDEWCVVGSEPLRMGEICHGSVLYSAGLRFIRHSNTSWKMNEPSDWNLWKRMQRIGVRIGFLDRITYTHYLGAKHRQPTTLISTDGS